MASSEKTIEARTAEFRLFFFDAVMASVLVLFLGAISTWANPFVDGILLALWAVVPVSIARFLRSRTWPQSALKGFGLIIAVVGFAVAVGATGWQFISASIDLNLGIGREVGIILLTSWASGFFLFQVQTYRLHDALSFGALSIGLVDGRPEGAVWAIIYILVYFLAAPIRHQLFDIHAYAARPRITPRYGRTMILGSIVAALVLFIFGEYATRTLVGEEGSSWGALVADNTERTIGWNNRLNLSDLGRVQRSEEPIFGVKIRDLGTGKLIAPPTAEKRNRTTLWRVIVLDQFLNDGSKWKATEKKFRASLNFDGRTQTYPRPRITGKAKRYELERISTEIKFIPHLYDLTQARITFSELPDLSLGDNGRGELMAFSGSRPDLAEGDKFLLTQAGRSGIRTIGIPRQDQPTATHLKIPTPEVLGFDLRPLAQEIIGRAKNKLAIERRLRKFYQETGFQYDVQAAWPEERRQGDTKLRTFITESRIGDCAYYSAATCLILRAAGIPSRLAQGFLGHKWDEKEQRYVIYEGSAHAWTEFWVPEIGWQPFDATQFVPNRRSEDGTLNETAAPITSNSKSKAKKKDESVGISRLFGDVSDDYNRTRLMMLLFGALGLVLFAAFLRRPRVAPRRAKKSGLQIPDENSWIPMMLPKPSTAMPKSEREMVLRKYEEWQDDLTRTRRQRAPEETPSEHARRLARDNEKLRGPLHHVARVFSDALFGRKTITPEVLRAFSDDLKEIKKRRR